MEIKSKFIKILSFLHFFTILSSPRAGHEVQNGGSLVLIEGKEYSIADLHFTPNEFSQYKLSARLEVELMTIQNTLKYFLDSDLTNALGQSFFDNEIFNKDVEFRFTHQLPSTCSFVKRSNLPSIVPEDVIDIACTHGAITYINPEHFQKLASNPTLQALIIIHERLHSFAPYQNYDVKMEFVSALSYLHKTAHLYHHYRFFVKNTVHEDAQSKQIRCEHHIEDSTLTLLNNFTLRARQLAGIRSSKPRDLTFTRHGAIIETHFSFARESASKYINSKEICLGDYIKLQ